MAMIIGVFVGATAHSFLSLDLSVAAGALTAGLVVQCQHSTGAHEMREFLYFVAGVAVAQGRRYGLFVIFIVFLIKGTVGTPTSSSGTSSLFGDVLDAGASHQRPSGEEPPSRRQRLLPAVRTRSRTPRTLPHRRLRRARGRVSPLIPPGSPPPWDTSPPPPPPLARETILAMSAPRADLLTFEQARQLHLELSAGHEPTPEVPPSITNTLAIVDTGCATSMAPLEDFMEKAASTSPRST